MKAGTGNHETQMTNRLRGALGVATVFALLVLSACGSPSGVEGKRVESGEASSEAAIPRTAPIGVENFQTYESAGNGFSFEYPEGWTEETAVNIDGMGVTDGSVLEKVNVYPRSDDDAAIAVSASVTSPGPLLSDLPDIEESLNAAQEEQAAAATDGEAEPCRPAEFGTFAMAFECRYAFEDDDGTRETGRQVTFFSGNRRFDVVLGGQPEVQKRYGEVFEKIASSVAQPRTTRYESETHPFAFDHPSSWAVEAEASGASETVQMRPQDNGALIIVGFYGGKGGMDLPGFEAFVREAHEDVVAYMGGESTTPCKTIEGGGKTWVVECAQRYPEPTTGAPLSNRQAYVLADGSLFTVALQTLPEVSETYMPERDAVLDSLLTSRDSGGTRGPGMVSPSRDAGPAPEPPSPTGARIVEEEAGFSWAPPEGWKPAQRSDSPYTVAEGRTTGGYTPYLVWFAEPAAMPLDEQIDLNIGSLRSNYPGTRVISREEFRTATGNRGVRVEAWTPRTQETPAPRHLTFYSFEDGDTMFNATCSRLAEGQEEAGTACDASMRTFQTESQ